MNASRTTRSTRSRFPSTTGTRPPSSSRASSTRPCARTRDEAEVGEEVAREDRLVHLEALERRVALVVAYANASSARAPLSRALADRRQEERLHHPRLRRVDEVGARDEHRVLARRPGGQLGGTREEIRRPVLHRAEQPPVVVVVDGPPGAPLLLGAADPAALVDRSARARLPEDALVAHRRRGRRASRRSGPRCASRSGPDLVDDDVDGRRLDVRHRAEVLAHARLHAPPDVGDRRAPVDDEVQLDAHARRRPRRP